MTIETEIELGATYRDVITGFRGVAVAYVTYITGCDQVLIAPPATNGNMQDSSWIDESRLLREEEEAVIKLPDQQSKAIGFDKPAPIR